MNKLNVLAAGLMLFAACSGSTTKSEEKIKTETTKVGADNDEHGCKTSAGYTWSVIKNDCVQIFNAGFRLNPTSVEKNEEVVSAFVLISDDQTKLELFLPERTAQSIVLPKVGDLLFEDATYKYDAVKSLLYVNGKLAYKGNVE